MLPHPLTNFETQKYYKNEPRFSGLHSRDNLPEITELGAYVTNLDGYVNIGTHWIALYVKNIEIVHFDGFGVEYVPKEIEKFIGHKNIKQTHLEYQQTIQ